MFYMHVSSSVKQALIFFKRCLLFKLVPHTSGTKMVTQKIIKLFGVTFFSFNFSNCNAIYLKLKVNTKFLSSWILLFKTHTYLCYNLDKFILIIVQKSSLSTFPYYSDFFEQNSKYLSYKLMLSHILSANLAKLYRSILQKCSRFCDYLQVSERLMKEG